MSRYTNIASMATLTLFLAACTSSTPPAPTIKPVPVQPLPTEVKKTASLNDNIDISQKSALFHTAVKDGCATAKGRYTKDSALYNSKTDYKDGWFYGRRKCQPRKAS